ncbi:MAG: rod shape-determining protein MreC [Ruminococcaceae bacterium]|nr:rod shape-determining protein MreC [Oscillospiraceae bacterium]
MKRFIKTTWFKVLIAVLCILLIFVIIAIATKGGSSPLSTAVGTVTEPLARASSAVGRGFVKISNIFTSSEKYEKQIKDLKEEIAGYQSKLADYEQTKQKLALYEGALGIKEVNPDYEFVPAIVIGKDASSSFTTFTFNKGSKDGVEKNDPVIYGEGQLIGVVTKVSVTYCVVSTILDPNVSLGAYEVRTRETGFLTNNASLAKEGLCRLSALERTTAIAPGGIVCTTGVGGVYPRDLIVGTVKEVRNDEHDVSSYAIIQPAADIDGLEDALILINFDGRDEQATVTPTETEK